MRRFKQLLPQDEAQAILVRNTNGVLSLIDADGMPYGVPLSFVYDGDGHIYFHSATAGHKLDCIEVNPHCSFCVVDKDEIVPDEFTSYFRSAIASGNIRTVSSSDEINRALSLLCRKYSPGVDSSSEIEKCLNHVRILRMDVESITGKEAIELVRARRTANQLS